MTQILCGADFETDHTEDETNTFVVQWSICRTDGVQHHGRCLDTFIDELRAMLHKCDEHKHHIRWIVGFHNIDYDGSYMLGALRELAFNEGYRFSVTCNDMKKIINMKVEEPRKHGAKIIFYDTAKLMNLKLQSIGELFGIPKLEPISHDFHVGWSKDLTDDPEQWRYVDRDAEIAMHVLKAYDDLDLLKGGTLASNALKNAQEICHLGTTYRGRWMDEFPAIPHEADVILRRSYAGGINFSEGCARHLAEDGISHFDVTSLYPTVMYYDPLPHSTLYRCRDRVQASWFGWYAATHRVKLHLKEDGIPWFKFRTTMDAMTEGMTTSDPVIDTWEWHEVAWDNTDEEQINIDYDVEYDPTYEELWFAADTRIGIFRPYIDHWVAKKEQYSKEHNKGMRYIAKLMLNSLYGRMGMGQEFRDTEVVYDEEVDDYVFSKSDTIDVKERNSSYIPYAISVCSHARKRWLEVGREYYRRGQLGHGDTDSVIIHGERIPLGVYGEEFGQWKDELKDTGILEWYEGGVKRYVEIYKDLDTFRPGEDKVEDFINVTCSGVPQNMKGEPGRYEYGVPAGMWVEILDTPSIIGENALLGNPHYRIRSRWLRDLYLHYGLDPDDVNTMKLLPKMIHGGKILVQTTFNIANAGFAIKYR